MEDKEILKKALEKAVENGYTGLYHNWYERGPLGMVEQHAKDFIFSHDFAKAFWGEEEICYDCGKKFEEKCISFPPDTYMHHVYGCDCGDSADPSTQIAWQFHLQQMVLEENPIKYLEKFI